MRRARCSIFAPALASGSKATKFAPKEAHFVTPQNLSRWKRGALLHAAVVALFLPQEQTREQKQKINRYSSATANLFRFFCSLQLFSIIDGGGGRGRMLRLIMGALLMLLLLILLLLLLILLLLLLLILLLLILLLLVLLLLLLTIYTQLLLRS
jgi:hypothetical protein